jgi:hypothetical protein
MKQRSIGYPGSLASSSPWTALALSAGVMLGSSCKTESPAPSGPAPAAVAPATPVPAAAPAAAKALEWDDPPQWKKVPPSSSMRKASYQIPPANGDKVPGELNVFILGGDIEPNIKRWVDEFSGFDPKSLVRHDRTVNDITQAVVEIPKGNFSGGMGGKEASANYGLLGAIVLTPSGAQYFFKLTGPSATVKAARDPFYKMLDAMRLEGGTPEKPGAAPEKKADTAPTAPASHALPAPPAPAGHAPAAPAPAGHAPGAPASKK